MSRAPERADRVERGAVSAFLAVDSGGSGVRVAVGVPGTDRTAEASTREPVRTSERGIDPAHLMTQVAPLARTLAAEVGADRIAWAVVGAAGFASLGDALRAELPGALARELGVGTVALAADAVTAYVGALGPRPGAVLAAGTGLIAVGTDLTDWRRADGWGHLLGDCGGGAWIGRAGLEAALRAYDGRDGGSAALLECATERFGAMTELPARIYPRSDRAAVLASFAPAVGECAAHDPIAAGILRAAARHLAESAAAVCPAEGEPEVALTGGLFRLGAPLLAPLREELAKRLPHATSVPAEGDPLRGAVRLAADLAAGRCDVPIAPTMLHVVTISAD
ncbi:N-acetylglucosamine kinase [Streptomyces sp. NPDC004376]